MSEGREGGGAEGLVLSCRGLQKTYGSGELAVPVLHGIDLDVQAGESGGGVEV
jgi:hypothetical protein